MEDKRRSAYMIGVFTILSAFILIAHYYFFVHRILVLEEVSPNSKYTIKCYGGPEYDQALVLFEADIGDKSIELSLASDRKPIDSSNFHIIWKEDGALVIISGDHSEMSPIELEFKVSNDSILTNLNQ